MKSSSVQFFHDHVLVKEPFTKKLTPWHADMPYYFLDGMQTVSMWIPLESVDKDTSLKFIAGSHLWKKMMRPLSWADSSDFYDSSNRFKNKSFDNDKEYENVPSTDLIFEKHNNTILSWALEPGDILMFHFKTAHAARVTCIARGEELCLCDSSVTTSCIKQGLEKHHHRSPGIT